MMIVLYNLPNYEEYTDVEKWLILIDGMNIYGGVDNQAHSLKKRRKKRKKSNRELWEILSLDMGG